MGRPGITIAIGFVCAPFAAHAAPVALSYELGLQSDLVERGLSQTGGRAALSGSVEAAADDLYAGAWVSSLGDHGRLTGDARAQIDLYAGWRPSILGVSTDLGLQSTRFSGTKANNRSDYQEVYLRLSRSVGPVTPGLMLRLSPRYRDTELAAPGRNDAMAYAEANAAWRATSRWTVSGALGYTRYGQRHRGVVAGPPGDYASWRMGANFALNDHVDLDLRYVDTDAHARRAFGEDVAGQRLIARIRVGF